MTSSHIKHLAGAIALLSLTAGCANMDRTEKGTAIGASSGAVAGAVVAGPVGAVVGAGVGGYVGHEGVQPAKPGTTRSSASAQTNDAALVRSVQQSLNDQGYNAGPPDGQWGPASESALRQFQQARGLAQTGSLDQQTLSALGVSR